MKNLWENIDQIAAQIKSKETPLILLLDFDGTLSSIKKDPKDAILPDKTRELLQKLSRKSQVFIGILSGRTLKDIKSLISIPNLIYAGNHGLEGEIEGKGYSFPLNNKLISIFPTILKNLTMIAGKFEGVIIENKKTAFSFHYRNVHSRVKNQLKSEFKKAVLLLIKSGKFTVLAGKQVYEIRPNIGWNKGKFAKMVIEKIIAQTKDKPVTIFIGDDTTDEDAFKELTGSTTIRVGQKLNSYASYYLKDTQDVFGFLQWIDKQTS